MFQKSLHVLLVALALLLAAIAGFALLRLAGPAKSLAEAEAWLARGEPATALPLLDLIERSPSVQADDTLQARVWRLRYAANRDLGNARGALLDVDRLLAHGSAADLELQLDRIRLLALADDTEAARAAATTFLVQHPDHGRGCELAGECVQRLYQPLLRDLRSRIDRDVGQQERDAARDLLLSFAYRPDGDPEAERSLQGLATMFASEPRRIAVWQPLRTDLLRLRELVQEALGHFRRSLELDGQPVAAFRAFALALDQAQRTDDLVVACEIQRRRFDHEYVPESGAAAAWALIREGLHAAASATATRWLPPGAVAAQLERGRVDSGTTSLLLAQSYAALQLGSGPMTLAAWRQAELLLKAKQPPDPLYPFAILALHRASKQKMQENITRWGGEMVAKLPTPIGQQDLAPIIFPAWAEALTDRSADQREVQAVLQTWVAARPERSEPVLALAAHLLGRGDSAAALATLQKAAAQFPHDPGVFDALLAGARAHYRDGALSGAGLLAQCLKRQQRQPETSDPLGYLLCAEAALAVTPQPPWWIALGSARAAVDAFPSTRQARWLEIEANLRANRPADAARLARRALDSLPPDDKTVQWALTAAVAAGEATRDLLAVALCHATPSPLLQGQLLGLALATAPNSAAVFATPAARAADAPPSLRLQACHAMVQGDEPAAVEPLLRNLLAAEAPWTEAERGTLVTILAAFAAAVAGDRSDPQFAIELQRDLARCGAPTAAAAPALLATAQRLAATAPSTAAVLLDRALAPPDAVTRTGVAYRLLGDLLARQQRWIACEEAWTAALGFADGHDAAADLARLCLLQGRIDRARTVAQLIETPQDPALAARLDHPDVAMVLLGDALLRDRADLLAHCLLALNGQPSLSDWAAATGAATQEPLAILSGLHSPHLAGLVLPRCEAAAARPGATRSDRLLLARARAFAGDGAGASRLHAELTRGQQPDALLYRELAVCASQPGYVPPPELLAQLQTAATAAGAAGIAGSATTLVFALERMAAAFAANGRPDVAREIRASLWRQLPTHRPPTKADLELIASQLPPAAAVTVLLALLAQPGAMPRDAIVDQLGALGPAAIAADVAVAPPLLATLLLHQANHGPRGAALHFVLHQAATVPTLAMPKARREELLQQHLEHAAAHGDQLATILQSAELLAEARGVGATATCIEDLLRRFPTALPLWLARARLLVGTFAGTTALAELRAVLRHVQAPELQLEYLTLAAQARRLGAEDYAAVAMLPPALRDSPAGRFLSALVALRLGQPDVAAQLLEQAPPRRDGMHLFAAAEALLQSSRSDGPAQARERLLALVRDYPSSSLARNAGSFAAQLAPR